MSQIVLTDRALLYKERDKEVSMEKKIRKERRNSCRVTQNFCMKLIMKDGSAKGGRIFAKF